MIVHRLLDVFFRTLDVVDATRDRIDQLLGREPRADPWAVEWPTPEDAAAAPTGDDDDGPNATEDEGEPEAVLDEDPALAKAPDGVSGDPDPSAAPQSPAEPAKKATAKKATAKKATAKKATANQSGGKKKAAAKKATAKKAATKKSAAKKSGAKKSASRKGSVDRSGKDIDSPRADQVTAHLRSTSKRGVIAEDADHGGKKVLGRTLWALAAARDAGIELGLTTADVSALLSRAADIEVFATNVGRACRDHPELIAATAPDGRSKRFAITDAGYDAAAALETVPLA